MLDQDSHFALSQILALLQSFSLPLETYLLTPITSAAKLSIQRKRRIDFD